jgi:hypothetical protein
MEIPASALNAIADLKSSLNGIAQGNKGEGWVEEARLTWPEGTEDLEFWLKVKIRNRHKTCIGSGRWKTCAVAYDYTETFRGTFVLRNCQVVESHIHAAGWLSELLFRNRKLIGDIARIFGKDIDINVLPQTPKELLQYCQ